MKDKRILLVVWLIMLVIYIAYAATGHAATWILTFCPLVCYLMELIDASFFRNRGEYDD